MRTEFQTSGEGLKAEMVAKNMPKTIVNDCPSHDLTAEYHYSCLCCKTKFKPKKTKAGKDKKFCSSKCRLLYWALNEILKAFRVGKANGLRGLIDKIKEL